METNFPDPQNQNPGADGKQDTPVSRIMEQIQKKLGEKKLNPEQTEQLRKFAEKLQDRDGNGVPDSAEWLFKILRLFVRIDPKRMITKSAEYPLKPSEINQPPPPPFGAPDNGTTLRIVLAVTGLVLLGAYLAYYLKVFK